MRNWEEYENESLSMWWWIELEKITFSTKKQIEWLFKSFKDNDYQTFDSEQVVLWWWQVDKINM